MCFFSIIFSYCAIYLLLMAWQNCLLDKKLNTFGWQQFFVYFFIFLLLIIFFFILYFIFYLPFFTLPIFNARRFGLSLAVNVYILMYIKFFLFKLINFSMYINYIQTYMFINICKYAFGIVHNTWVNVNESCSHLHWAI